MTIDNFKNLFYSTKVSCIFNFLLGLATFDVILVFVPYIDINNTPLTILSISMFSFIGILPVLSYNIMRLRMIKFGELNYGMFRYTLSTLPFIVPMLIYYIAWLRGFRLK